MAIEERSSGSDDNHDEDMDDGITDDKAMQRVSEEEGSIVSRLEASPAPPALPPGWVVRRSRSQPGYVYYYDQESGECRWDPPYSTTAASVAAVAEAAMAVMGTIHSHLHDREEVPPTSAAVKKSILKKSFAAPSILTDKKTESHSTKKRKAAEEDDGAMRGRKGENVEEVRVLHILKKHVHSRRPSSWRSSTITLSVEEARNELLELISILSESRSDFKELRATFEELARTESDCSSAKRGGDLGFFGRKKMQPAFESASFALRAGEMTDTVVETSSGVHIILRLA